MKCDSCKNLWRYPADYTSPYGEYACLKLETDLYGVEPEDVEDCEYYELDINDTFQVRKGMLIESGNSI